ncbi:hypothetical protein CPB85DRAFT_1220489 [Mucidula mucida]|nr:hypothetical protein CPB85DRAFT_1220489 [Mucidula mucida]
MQAILKKLLGLKLNFPKSVYAAACFNLSRNCICFKHRDILNVPYGWCAVTGLGRFNHIKGAQIVLWDLKLYFEFPHGCTLYIPSASIVHLNTPLNDPSTKERTSFIQYFPGALIRWVDNGFMTDKELKEKNKRKFDNLARWKLQ